MMIMKGKVFFWFMALMSVSCSKEEIHSERDIDYTYGRDLSHQMIVLGKRLDNPYKTSNIAKAMANLYPTKADRVEVVPTDLYVRFLPADEQECDILEGLGLELTDHPLDYDIAVEGDWYHDPEVPDTDVTWQYAVVPRDFRFPDIQYEIIDECHIAEHLPSSKTSCDGIDWEAVEQEAYRITGNASRLAPQTRASSKTAPSGRITIVDRHCNGGKPFGVAGVKVVCNSFVKFDQTYTDRDGYYSMSRKYSSKLRYRLVFKNQKGFSIGFNLILVPASVSTLGKAGPEGVNVTITETSETKLFRRCVVNNAAYEYYSRCSSEDMGIAPPPSDLRFWLFEKFSASSAVMLHHGTVLTGGKIGAFLGKFAPIVEYFLPDITIGMQDNESYRDLYSAVCHELAHASHFVKAGKAYWNSYIYYIVESYLRTGGMTYGDGTLSGAGHCEIGESWAYYVESKMYKERYGGSFPSFGTSYWFYPQLLRYLDERGVTRADIYSVLSADVDSLPELKEALLRQLPAKRTVIEQVFNRFGR